MVLLSCGSTSIESQFEMLQPMAWFRPLHYRTVFARNVTVRGAGSYNCWPQFLVVADLACSLFGASLAMFRHSISVAK